MPNIILEAKKINKFFGDKNKKVLNDVSLKLNKGEILCLLGPSGSGKTTLLKSLAGLEHVNEGEIKLSNNLTINHTTKDSNTWRSNISMVFQDYNLWPNKTVLENIILAPILIQKKEKEETIKLAETLLKKFNLYDKKDSYPDFLSGGQKQRVAIIRALATNPKVLLLDEITSALDPQLISGVLKTIKILASEGQSMIITTHHIKFATEVADKIIYLEDGKVIQKKNTQDFFYSQKNKNIKNFIADISANQQKINIYEDYDEFQSYHLGLIKRLKNNSNIFVVGAVGNRWYECMGKHYNTYEDIRIAKKIKWNMVVYKESEMDKKLRTKYPEFNEFKIIPKNLETPANYNIVDDSVIIQTFGKTPAIIEINNADVAKAYLNYFNLLWEKGKIIK